MKNEKTLAITWTLVAAFWAVQVFIVGGYSTMHAFAAGWVSMHAFSRWCEYLGGE